MSASCLLSKWVKTILTQIIEKLQETQTVAN